MAIKNAKRINKVHKVEKLMHVAKKMILKVSGILGTVRYNKLTLPIIEPNIFAGAFKNNFIDSEKNFDAVNDFSRRHNELFIGLQTKVWWSLI